MEYTIMNIIYKYIVISHIRKYLVINKKQIKL
jgi:hypothetical protein